MSQNSSSPTSKKFSTLNWLNLSTLISIALLVGTELIGAAWAAGWALGGLLQLSETVIYAMEAFFIALSALAVVAFIRVAAKKEPIYRN